MIEALHRLIPASESLITGINNLTADNVLAALDAQGVFYRVIRLGINDWETESSELTDKQIFALLHMNDAVHKGTILICTEACTRYGNEPFSCDAQELEQFISDYKNEMFFDGDVVMLSEQSKTLTVYHHAGGYVHLKL